MIKARKQRGPGDEVVAQNSGGPASKGSAPRTNWSVMGAHEHFVQFYDTDIFLLDSLKGFIGEGLSSGESCVVVATKSLREGLEQRLHAKGLDLCEARERGRFISLDASETLSRFMVDGSPNPDRFAESVGGVLAEAGSGSGRVRVFGEMVALLWAEGNCEAAIRLEELWNDMQKRRPFQLFCAYPMSVFSGVAQAEGLGRVCETHSSVVPAESYNALESPDDRLRAIALLQQKAKSLQAIKDELELQVEDLRRLHEMSASLARTLDMELVLGEVLRAAMAVQGTNLGLLSLCEQGRDGLNVKFQSGFGEDYLRLGDWVAPGEGACGDCYQQRRRVVVEDTESDKTAAGYREVARAAGFRACHSTPLITRRGNIIGVLSVHFRQPHRPSERECRLMDLYAQMAADTIENARLHSRVQQELEEHERLLTSEQAARAEAENANRLKDEFLATVSHELRTPLNAIIGWSHMLRASRLDEPTVNRGLETIERNAKSQAQLIEDILDVSRVITGKLRLNVGPVDLASVINSAVDSVQLAADSKEIRLAVTLDPSARRISGDSSRLQQVVWNLLSNAIKFTPAGGRVEICLEHAGMDAQIRVCDTGCGISREFLPCVFERFRQADGTSTRGHGGLGLGLAIVRHLVEIHGGSVGADSQGEGQGSTFTIRLPLTSAHESASGRARVAGRTVPDGDDSLQPNPLLKGVNVLLVDDDKDTLQMLAVMLREQGALVEVSAAADEALEVLRWYRPDVLVCDLAMPGEDGFSLIAKVREMEGAGGRQTPAVALTAYVRIEDRARALSAGFNMFVPKPVQPDELVAAIANLASEGTTDLYGYR